MKLIFLGPPGAGKGTQAQVLKEKLGLRHISTGDIFRDLIKNGSELGSKIKGYVESGGLVPDEIAVEVVAQTVKGLDLNKGFVLDGFPRTLVQAELLDKTLAELGIRIDRVFYFDTSESMIINRLGGRRICPKCSATYHVINLPPKKEGICDNCGNELYQRKDDSPDTIKKRLAVYENQTKELIEYYRKKKLLDTINGDLSKDEAFVILRQKLALS